MIAKAIGLEKSGVFPKWDAGSWHVRLYIMSTRFHTRVLDDPQNLLKVSSSPLKVNSLTQI